MVVQHWALLCGFICWLSGLAPIVIPSDLKPSAQRRWPVDGVQLSLGASPQAVLLKLVLLLDVSGIALNRGYVLAGIEAAESIIAEIVLASLNWV